MTRRPETYIYDALQAANAIEAFVVGQGYADYQESALLRSAVERQFEIIGEALNRLRQLDVELFARVRGGRQAIGLRNILIHGYASVDDAIVWATLEQDLPLMQVDLETLIASNPSDQ
ncbi:hypothetical protein C84B14_14606 [Salinisphaera sp. C84B14]|uniref:HepT-like ribonuclease domain-containing protein n=1 Tax=Salinisphaera sp. C84B14 TaxID=1304155 RepID=UPI00334122C3